MTDIKKDIEELKQRSVVLEKDIRHINDLLYKGNDLVLPIALITSTLEETKEIIDRHNKCLEVLQGRINKITTEDMRSKNQIKYMFLVLLLTALGKFLFNIPYVQYLIGK